MNFLQGLNPDIANKVMAAGEALDAGRVEQAETHLTSALAAYPEHPEILRLQAGIHGARGQHQDAIRTMQRALAQRPDEALYHNTMGTLLGAAGQYEAAIAALQRTCQLQPQLVLAWYNLGVMLTKCVRPAKAADALRRAVLLAPGHLAARALLADMLRTQGKASEAAAEYRRLIALRPTEGMAWWGLADLKSSHLDASDIEQMRAALGPSAATDNDRVAIGFALAKALDDVGQYALSLDALAQANALARRHHSWDAHGFSAQVNAINLAFEATHSDAPAALGAEVIFIVSLPRAGSTLVEQILASHGLVEGAGELPDLPTVLAEESQRRGKPFPHWVGDMQPGEWESLGKRYLARTARWRRERPVFIDKLPNNWLYIGAIAAMLPGARIVAGRRDPLENCFSCYRQRLDAGSGYSRTFDDLASFWRDFDRSIRHWKKLWPSSVREHSYEALLADPQTQIRDLLNFCGLPFDANCLQFHETRREVRSPSAEQVRRPLQQDTARAHAYGSLLDPLRKALNLPLF